MSRARIARWAPRVTRARRSSLAATPVRAVPRAAAPVPAVSLAAASVPAVSLAAASLVLASLVLAGCKPTSTPVAAGSGTPTPMPATTQAAPPSPSGGSTHSPSPGPTSPSRSPAPAGPLAIGSSGPAVTRLQQQLTALGYWLGTVDGRFGGNTQQAVYAAQKAAGLSPTGTVTAATQRAIDSGTRPTARSTSGHQIEVNIAKGLLLFVTNGHVDYAVNTSTGGGYVYYEQGQREVATTPRGHFSTYRVIDGPDQAPLGLLMRPRFFTGGYAIHGDSSVPPNPVSHGCVRVTDATIDWIWSANLDPIGTPVWIY